MKKIYAFLFLIGSLYNLKAQTSRDAAVELESVIDKTNKSITLKWRPDNNCNEYRVFKMNSNGVFGTAIKKLTKNDSMYLDTNIEIGKLYEYAVQKVTGGVNGLGFIQSGIEVPIIEGRGRMILLVEKSIANALPTEISSLIADLTGDGWFVQQINIPANSKVDSVKNLLDNIYQDHSDDLKAIFVLGHVPVPYSGNINPDGHPDHKGAWPADGFYADMDQYYTDNSINNVDASRTANQNIPKDGKYDYSTFPGTVELQIGRVDLADMPVFTESETELIQKYLLKAHNFKIGVTKAELNAVIDDNFGWMGGEAFAGNAWRNFPPMLGINNYSSGKYFETLKNKTYLWSYGTGGGWYQGAGGVGNTDSFNLNNTNSIFTMLFGSYFGDWDVQNSFLRAPLAAPKSMVLTNVWAGRPWWQFHHMAMGQNIGFEANVAMNNANTYTNGYSYGNTMVHLALMGDPSLRLHYFEPASTVTAKSTAAGKNIELSWTKSPDNRVIGYHIYRSDSTYGKYSLISTTPVNGTTFTDMKPKQGNNVYMVRAVVLENTPSGSYYNQSLGAFSPVATSNVSIAESNQNIQLNIYPNPATDKLYIQLSENNNHVIIYDIMGKVLYNQQLNNGQHEISLQSFSKGNYIIQIQHNEYSKTAKFSIN